MVSTKSINVLTISIIIVTNIIVENSNASEDFTGAEAFEYIYRSMKSLYISKAKVEGIFTDYIDNLFKAAMSVYKDDILMDPVDWCLSKREEFEIFYKEEAQCKFKLEPLFKNSNIDNAEKALKYAYYHIRVAKGYYNYMIETFLPHIDKSPAQGPEEYCRDFDAAYYYYNYCYYHHHQNLQFLYKPGEENQPVNRSEAGEGSNNNTENLPMTNMFYKGQFDNVSSSQLSTELHQPPEFPAQGPDENYSNFSYTRNNLNLPFPNTFGASRSNTVPYTEKDQSVNRSKAGNGSNNNTENLPMPNMFYKGQFDNASSSHLSTKLHHPRCSDAQIPDDLGNSIWESTYFTDYFVEPSPEYYQNAELESTYLTDQFNPATVDQFDSNQPAIQDLGDLSLTDNMSFLPPSVTSEPDYSFLYNIDHYNPDNDK